MTWQRILSWMASLFLVLHVYSFSKDFWASSNFSPIWKQGGSITYYCLIMNNINRLNIYKWPPLHQWPINFYKAATFWSRQTVHTLTFLLTSLQRPSLYHHSINDWRTVFAKTGESPIFFILKHHQTWSILHNIGLCFCLVSVLLIMLVVLRTASMLKKALFKKENVATWKKNRFHVTPLHPHNSHYPLSPR